jgi:hypothetical protein
MPAEVISDLFDQWRSVWEERATAGGRGFVEKCAFT